MDGGGGGVGGGAKRSPSLKSGTVIPYLKNIQKIYKSRDTTVLYIFRLLGQFLLSLFYERYSEDLKHKQKHLSKQSTKYFDKQKNQLSNIQSNISKSKKASK